ncbi:MAG: hypothetical protein KDI98_05915 [Hyphomicrobiaceae bacterium]|nr:hypothetical protein [Hyphomicrobiaceae bacterium]
MDKDRRFILTATGLFAGLALAATAGVLVLAQAPEAAEGRLVAVFSPNTDAQSRFRALAASGASFVRESLPQTMVVVDIAGPDAPARLRAAGAVLVYDQLPFGGVLGGCIALLPLDARDP